MSHTKFEESLLLYGADLSQWPEVLRLEAEGLLAADEGLRAKQREMAAFEARAMQRPLLTEDDSFAERIIALASKRHPALSWRKRLALLGDEFMAQLPFPKPAYAFACLAVFGFLVGAATVGTTTTSTQSTTASDSDLLYQSQEII